MATKVNEREQFVAVIAQEFPNYKGSIAGWCREIMGLARRHGKIQERACNGHQKWNGDWDEEAATRDEKREERIEAKIKAMCAEIGCEVEIGGDPRGYTVKLKLPSKRFNSFGGVECGWGVPQ